jgi:hypothetical protein
VRDAADAGRTEYLIEVPHAPEECSAAHIAGHARIRRIYRGCTDGTHTTWIIAELAGEQEAWHLVPRLLRDTARVTRVDRSPTAPDSTDETKEVFRDTT